MMQRTPGANDKLLGIQERAANRLAESGETAMLTNVVLAATAIVVPLPRSAACAPASGRGR